MLIGLTYDLREDYRAMGFGEEDVAEFDCEETIAGIEGALRALGHRTERVGSLPGLMSALLQGRRWDLVFNIAEGLHGYGRESQIPCVLDWHSIPYTFSEPMTLAVGLHKGMTKHVVRAVGVPTPDFAVVEDPADATRVDLPFPLFVKPVAEGTGLGIGSASRVTDKAGLAEACTRLIARFDQPVIVETFLPGRELTVGIAGTGPKARSLGALEVIFGEHADPSAYGYVNKQDWERRMEYRIASDAEAQAAERVALDAWRALGCRDGGRVDLRMDADGVPNFIEVNPLAGLNPTYSDLPILCRLNGMPYQELIAAILDSAIERVGAVGAARLAPNAVRAA